MNLYTYNAQLVRVIDGDTIVANIDLGFKCWKSNVHLRLARIDCPEIKGKTKHLGNQSKNFVMATLSEEFIVVSEKLDSFGRSIAEIYIDNGRINFNDLIVANGFGIYKY